MKNVIVLIPVYKPTLSQDELCSLNRCIEVLKSYDIGLICPCSLEMVDTWRGKDFRIYKFRDHYFKSIDGYNRLMLNKEFYQTYSDYQYILIYQLDAIAFFDDLERFLKLDYDYIGAPWIFGQTFSKKVANTFWSKISKLIDIKIHDFICDDKTFVGNGGLSLRKVSSFIKILSEFECFLNSYSDNEDVFFSWIGKMYPDKFKVAPLEIALQFSFETYPRECYEMNGRRIPFGCHAWKKYDPEFLWELLNSVK